MDFNFRFTNIRCNKEIIYLMFGKKKIQIDYVVTVINRIYEHRK